MLSGFCKENELMCRDYWCLVWPSFMDWTGLNCCMSQTSLAYTCQEVTILLRLNCWRQCIRRIHQYFLYLYCRACQRQKDFPSLLTEKCKDESIESKAMWIRPQGKQGEIKKMTIANKQIFHQCCCLTTTESVIWKTATYYYRPT